MKARNKRSVSDQIAEYWRKQGVRVLDLNEKIRSGRDVPYRSSKKPKSAVAYFGTRAERRKGLNAMSMKELRAFALEQRYVSDPMRLMTRRELITEILDRSEKAEGWKGGRRK